MLSPPNPATVLARTDRDGVCVADLLLDPGLLAPLVDAVGRRFGSDDRKLLIAQVARESIAALVTAAVEPWAAQRRLPDLSAANVVLRASPTHVVAEPLDDRITVLDDDVLADDPATEVLSEVEMFDRLVDQVIGYPVALGEVPPGRPASIAAVSVIVATVRRLVRSGDRHLWGTAAQAVASTLVRASHTVGERTERDRIAIFGTRPDLARTVDLVTVEDFEGAMTFGVRRTCCLLFKLPGAPQCATCSLRDRPEQVAHLTDWYRTRRREKRGDTPLGV